MLAITDPIVESGKGKVSTRYDDDCYRYHADCLAVLVQQIIEKDLGDA